MSAMLQMPCATEVLATMIEFYIRHVATVTANQT